MMLLKDFGKYFVCILLVMGLNFNASAKAQRKPPPSQGRVSVDLLLGIVDASSMPQDFDYIAPALKMEWWLYLSAVVDAGEGSKWCVGSTPTIDDVLVASLREAVLRSPATGKLSAAPQIAKMLSTKFPCAASSPQVFQPRVSLVYLIDTAKGLKLGENFHGNKHIRAVSHFDTYVSGVRDAAEGQFWCIVKSNIPPHEVNEMILENLQQLSDASPENESKAAVSMVRDFLIKKFPCAKKEAK